VIDYAIDFTLDLVGYTDFDWVGDGIDHKSIFGYVFSFGLGPICWSSRKQSSIALLTA
jgi:hypothetical protein